MARFRFYALWLCLICIIMFIIQNLFAGFTDALILTPAAFPEFWRFLTSIFLHGSLTHLLFNLFGLALFGSILEKVIGSRKFLIVFFVSGLFANLIAFNFYPASLGASGAIYGILGALTVMRPGMMVLAFGFPMPMFIAAVLWIAGGVLGLFFPSDVGDIAHLSGIAAGFLLGIIFRFINKQRRIKKSPIIEISDPSETDLRHWEQSYLLRR